MDLVAPGHVDRVAYFAEIAGVSSISSSNSQGMSQITLQFDLSRSIDAAAQDVQSMIARAQRQLPPGMPSPPSYQRWADAPESPPALR